MNNNDSSPFDDKNINYSVLREKMITIYKLFRVFILSGRKASNVKLEDAISGNASQNALLRALQREGDYTFDSILGWGDTQEKFIDGRIAQLRSSGKTSIPFTVFTIRIGKWLDGYEKPAYLSNTVQVFMPYFFLVITKIGENDILIKEILRLAEMCGLELIDLGSNTFLIK